MKKSAFLLAAASSLCCAVVMLVSAISILDPAGYHPLWVLVALGYGVSTVRFAVDAYDCYQKMTHDKE